MYAKFITEKMPGSRIAILYQNDDLGKDFVGAFRSYMKDDFGKLVVAKSYEAADPTVEFRSCRSRARGRSVLYRGVAKIYGAGSP